MPQLSLSRLARPDQRRGDFDRVVVGAGEKIDGAQYRVMKAVVQRRYRPIADARERPLWTRMICEATFEPSNAWQEDARALNIGPVPPQVGGHALRLSITSGGADRQQMQRRVRAPQPAESGWCARRRLPKGDYL